MTATECQTTIDKFSEYGILINPHFQYYFFTDGSGWTDGFGGYSGVILNTTTFEITILLGGQNRTTVPRQEFKALLECLEHIHKVDSRRGLDICHYSDCEALVKSIRCENGKESNHDLWHFFEYFERYYTIETNHVKRTNEILYMQIADLHASAQREQIKTYCESTNCL